MWLLTGEGSMLRNEGKLSDIEQEFLKLNPIVDYSRIVKYLLDNQAKLLESTLFIDFLNDCNREIQHQKIVEEIKIQ